MKHKLPQKYRHAAIFSYIESIPGEQQDKQNKSRKEEENPQKREKGRSSNTITNHSPLPSLYTSPLDILSKAVDANKQSLFNSNDEYD